MGIIAGAHDPSGPSGHLPFAVSAKGRNFDYNVGRTSSTSKHSMTSPTLMSS
jgi:hypothetical protein